MDIRRFDDPDAFCEHVAPFLTKREAENNLLFGLLGALQRGEYQDKPKLMIAVERDGEIGLVALQAGLKLVISAGDWLDALYPLAQSIHPTPLPGVTALSKTSRAFAEMWCALSGQTYVLDTGMRIYRLERVIPAARTAGTLRRVTHDDFERLVQWAHAFQRDTFGTGTEEEARAVAVMILNSPPERRGVYFWEVDGQPVSMAAYAGPTPNGIRVNYVYTPPEMRGRGYASACVAALSQMLLDGGRKFLFLFTDVDNPTSNHIYQEIGYQPVADVDSYSFQ